MEGGAEMAAVQQPGQSTGFRNEGDIDTLVQSDYNVTRISGLNS